MNLWHDNLKNTVKKFEYMQLKSCRCVFKFIDETQEAIIMVSNDDLEILGPKSIAVKCAKMDIMSLFYLKKLVGTKVLLWRFFLVNKKQYVPVAFSRA